MNPTISFIFVDFGLKCSIGQVGLENWISGKSGLTPQNIGQAGQPPEPNQKRWEVAVQERHGVALEQEGRDHGNDVQTEIPAAPNSVFRMNDRIVGLDLDEYWQLADFEHPFDPQPDRKG